MIEVLNLDNWREQTSDEYSDWLHRASAALTELHSLEEAGHSCRCERCRRDEYSGDMIWDSRFGKLCPLCVEVLSRTDCLEKLKQQLKWEVKRAA